jgi:hypothetical protein
VCVLDYPDPQDEVRESRLHPRKTFVVRNEFALRVLLLPTLDAPDARTLLAPNAEDQQALWAFAEPALVDKHTSESP